MAFTRTDLKRYLSSGTQSRIVGQVSVAGLETDCPVARFARTKGESQSIVRYEERRYRTKAGQQKTLANRPWLRRYLPAMDAAYEGDVTAAQALSVLNATP